ncbi:MAG TPA: riboflavin kinase, partial [Rhodocyclaceae bacterium]|nr:riboflavin kinase [Rhodocyclaceae bacterium]
PQPIPGGATKPLPGVATKPLPGVANIGVRPTLADGLKPVLEVHLLDFERDIYGAHVTINFLHKIRDEKKFASLDALKAQIADDIAATRTSFAGKT